MSLITATMRGSLRYTRHITVQGGIMWSCGVKVHRDPMSTSMACFTAALVVSGPGVNLKAQIHKLVRRVKT